MKQETIEKLLSSKNIEDVCVGLELTYKNFQDPDDYQDYLKPILCRDIAKVDVYIGEFNIVFYGDGIGVDVFNKWADPGRNYRVIRL